MNIVCKTECNKIQEINEQQKRSCVKALSQLAHDQKRPNSRAIEKFRFGS